MIADHCIYTDFNKNINTRNDSFIKRTKDMFLFKDKSLAYQKEFRFVLLNEVIEKGTIFKIKKISDYARIYNTNYLFGHKKKFKLEVKPHYI